MKLISNFALPTKDESIFLKLLAILFMTIDHVGMILLPEILWLRIVGRLAFPLFAYQFAVSVNLTKHPKKMGLNLIIFALISQIVYVFINNDFFKLNIFFTLFLAWLTIYLIKNIKNIYLKLLFLAPILIFLLFPFFIKEFPEIDYGIYGVFVLIFFAFFLKKPTIMNIGFIFSTIIFCILSIPSSNSGSLLQIFCLFSIPLFYLRIPVKIKLPNILYYTYYPLHLAILLILSKILK